MKRPNLLSFKSARELHKLLASLPETPPWKAIEVTVEGGTTKEPIILLYRDGLALFAFLYGNPLFEGYQSNFPFSEWEDSNRDVRVYGGPMSGDVAMDIQVRFLSFLPR